MPRGNQVARLYTLVIELARTKHGLPVERLASKHRWRPRTVYRDLHSLETAGFPITRADGARWKLIDGWQERIPFPMPVGQLLALHVARSLMAPLRGMPLARDLDALYERLAGLPPAAGAQGELFPRFRSVLATRSQLAIDYSKHEAVLETLCRACETRTTVRIVYYVPARDEITRRRIDPYSLYYDPQLEALYVFAWCHLRRAMRTFAVHRFRQAAPTERRFEVPVDFTPERYLRGAFRIWRGENTVHIRLCLERETARWVAERRWHASQKVRHLAGGGVGIEFTVDDTTELERFVLGLGASCEVVEPGWFRDRIAREHERASRRSRQGPKHSLTPDDSAVRDHRA
jgi:predicted DNA-binding transcriptional regulator YafY